MYLYVYRLHVDKFANTEDKFIRRASVVEAEEDVSKVYITCIPSHDLGIN